MNLNVNSAHRQRKSLECEHKKRWQIMRADIRPGVYGPLTGEKNVSYWRHLMSERDLSWIWSMSETLAERLLWPRATEQSARPQSGILS